MIISARGERYKASWFSMPAEKIKTKEKKLVINTEVKFLSGVASKKLVMKWYYITGGN